jgi:hypothetical protein
VKNECPTQTKEILTRENNTTAGARKEIILGGNSDAFFPYVALECDECCKNHNKL